MKHRAIKRCISVLVCMCMCISLFPGFVASAAVTSNIKEITSDSSEALTAALPDGGHVLKYKSFVDTEDGKTYVKIEVGAYNAYQVQTYLLKLKYNKDVVTPVVYQGSEGANDGLSYNTSANGTEIVAEATSGKITLSELFKNTTFSPVSKQSETVVKETKLLSSRWNENTQMDSLTSYQAPFQFAQGTRIGTVTDSGTEFGTLSVEMTTQSETEMTALRTLDIYKSGFIGEGDGQKSVNLTFGQSGFVSLYSLYFRVADDAIVNKSTITIWSDDANQSVPKGSAFKRYDTDGGSDSTFVTEDVAMMNFPGENTEYPQRIKVENPAGNAIVGAKVVLKKADDGTEIGTFTSNADGLLVDSSTNSTSIMLRAQNYSYVATRTDYLEATGTLQVLGDGSTLVITMRYASEASYNVTIRVKDADTGDPVPNASVTLNTIDFPGITDAAGEISSVSSADKDRPYPLVVSCSGYQTKNTSITLVPTVDYKNLVQSLFEVEIVPERAPVKILTPIDKKTGNPITYSNVTITKLSTTLITSAWGGVTNSENHSYTTEDVDAGGYTFNLPYGRQNANMVYKINATATGYEPSDTYYMTIDNNKNVKYYSDDMFTSEVGILQLELEPYSEPLYTVTVEKPEFDLTQMLDYVDVTVSLRNINAFYGTFGIKYDSSIMTLKNPTTNEAEFQIDPAVKDSQITYFQPWPEAGLTSGAPISTLKNPLFNDTDGYHVFTWRSIGDSTGDSFKTLGSNVQIATYRFWAKSSETVLEELISKSTFSVIEYDKTENGQAAETYYGSKEAAKPFLHCYWRPVDSQNDATPLPDGRLERSMALNGGFYQAYAEEVAVEGEVVPATGNKLYDIKTDIQYSFPVKSIARLQFNVKNENEAWVDSAIIQLYSSDKFTVTDGKAMLKDGVIPTLTLTTDSVGSAYTLLEAVSETTYGYRVMRTGYWDYPIDTVDGNPDLTTVKVLNDRTDTEDIVLESRTYHPVKLALIGDGAPANVNAVAINLGASRAYNGNDYIFNIQARPGYTFKQESALAFSIGEVSGVATYDTAKNAYVISGNDVAGLSTALTPDAYGFQADDLIIKLNYTSNIGPAPSDEKYIATGTAGSHGSVTYDATGGSGTDTTSGNVVTVTDIPSGGNTGKFTFTPDEGYLVDKVYINGSETTAYRGKTFVEYQFTGINRDRNIVVTFGLDGGGGTVNPSTDTLLTVVVADRGSVTLGQPDEVKDKNIPKNTTKTFILNDVPVGGKFVQFTPTAESGYIKDKVIANGTEISANFFTAVQGKNNILLVSFKLSGKDSFNVFVTARVISGTGEISPAGITGYSIGTSPVYEMTPGSDLIMGSISVDGVESEVTDTGVRPYQYQLEPLTANTDLGVKFAEVGYKVTGRIDLKQGAYNDGDTPAARYGMGAPNSGAVVKFVRQSDGYEAPFLTTSHAGRVVEFEKELPVGKWTITVSKLGYVDYIITDFEVKALPEGQVNEICPGAIAITPYIGDASHDGKYITLEDIGLVANGFMTTSSSTSKSRADVNDDGILDVDNDMYFAKRNYAQKAVKISHSDFVSQ